MHDDFPLPVDAAIAEEMIHASVTRIRDFLAAADDKTLSYLRLTAAQRQEFLTTPLPLHYTPFSGGYDLRLRPDPGQFVYNENFAHHSPATANKIVAHEIGRLFTKSRQNMLCRKIAAPARHMARNFGWTLPVGGAALGYILSGAVGACAGTALGTLAQKTTQAILFYPARREEMAAARFADRLIPEVPTRSVIAQASMLYPSEHRRSKRRPFAKIQHVFRDKPSDFTRIRKSSKNCKNLLAEKRRLGVPRLCPA